MKELWKDTLGPASRGKSVLPEWKALERIALAAIKYVDYQHGWFELIDAVRDYEAVKNDTRS